MRASVSVRNRSPSLRVANPPLLLCRRLTSVVRLLVVDDGPGGAALIGVTAHQFSSGFVVRRPRCRAALIHREAVDLSADISVASAFTGYGSPSSTSVLYCSAT